ncbi:hypothetical protein GGR52DRAFT_593095 [Hypoxylon sp. FL1284]|nr:hypothetical protein GGR52DRAFT_593095 [Hypoxylon sp. FL1284]
MASAIAGYIAQFHAFVTNPEPRPGLHPIPGSNPLTFGTAILPPLVYYVALLLLAPPPPPIVAPVCVKTIRNVLALTAGFLFFRLPLAYHVPQSIGLTYQLGLVGFYGGCRVLDAFFISPYCFGHIPRRVVYVHKPRVETPGLNDGVRTVKDWSDEWAERRLTGKADGEPADVGKVLGGFLCSALVHAASVRCVLGGDWAAAAGEAAFFALNGVAVVVEGAVVRAVRRARRRGGRAETVWYDGWVGRAWWVAVVLGSGRYFTRGWVKSGLVRETAFIY